MAAPNRLRRGNAFQEIVQADFIATSQGSVKREFHIELAPEGTAKEQERSKKGRVDIWIDDLGDNAVAVFEIKATDWDLINPRNVRRNIYRHQKQLLDYVYTYVNRDDLVVTLGLIYPWPPGTEGLREKVEELAMAAYDVPVYWYTELNPEFDPLRLSRLLDSPPLEEG